MYKFFAAFAAFAALLVAPQIFPTASHADQLNFTWDYDAEQQIDGFRLYSGPMGQDETGKWVPKYADTPLVSSISPDSRSVTANEPGWADTSKKFCFTVRAYKGDVESANAVSADGLDVCKTIDNTPLVAPSISAGSYDRTNKMIYLSWTQIDARSKYFKIFYRAESETDYTELVQLENEGQDPVTLDAAIDTVKDGELKTLYFVVVAFKNDNTYSPDSAEYSVVVDRSNLELPAPNNFQFSVLIPIQ